MAELMVRSFEDGDLAEVLTLLDRSLGTGPLPRTPVAWRWKHRENPLGASPGLVATAGGKIVGVRFFLRWRWRAGDEDIAAVRAVDTATHPDWRGRGVFRRLTETLVEQVRAEETGLVFNTPNASSRPGYLKMGFCKVGRLRLLVRPKLRGGSLELRPVEELLAEPSFERFLAGCFAGERRLHTPRDPAYLAWRYAAAPGLGYRALWDLEGEEGAVVIVRPRRRAGLAELSLVEVLTSSGEAALDRLLRHLAGAPANLLTAMAASGTPERRALRRAGFFPLVVPGRWLTALALRSSKPDPTRWSSFRFGLGDLELF